MKGDLLTRDGDDRAAISWYDRALRLAPAATIQLPPDLAEGLRRAEAASLAAAGRFEDHLRERLAAAGVSSGNGYGRFAEALDILSGAKRSEEHTSELQSLMRISYAVFCLKKQKNTSNIINKNKTISAEY